MPSKLSIVAGFLVLGMIAGGRLLFSARATNFPTDLIQSHSPNILRHSLRANNLAGTADNLTSHFLQLGIELLKNKQLILYGAIAIFGVLMMLLVIGSASSPPKNKSEAVLETLKQEKDRAEHLAKLKSEFLNQVSHELRTPLAVIIGYIECMTDGLYGEIESKHQEILQVVAKQSSHLKNMIDQILIYSRLESNKQAIRIEEISLSKLVGDLRETFDFLCHQKGLRLEWNVSENLPSINTDPERFKEILSNLLQNALKYTDKGSILVEVQEGPAAGSITIDVTDTGMGIPQHYLDTIFEPFMQVHKTSTEQSRGGIGLGLSIVRKDVDQLNGNITVASEIGKGSTFRIVLPRVSSSRPINRNRLFTLLKNPFALAAKNPSIAIPQRSRPAEESRKRHRAG